MSKIRTILDLQDLLDRDFAWRLKEISDVKTTIRSSDGIKKGTLLRAGVALLYAHWEGFIKNSSECYLSFVANQKLNYQELKTCFIVVGLKKELDFIASSKKHEKNSRIVEFLRRELGNRSNLSYKELVSTESNLNSIVFQNVAATIGLDISAYETKFNLIDESLLHRRNKIAHGEILDITSNEFSNLVEEIIGLMRMYKNDIENSAVMKLYKIPSVTNP